MVKAKTSKRNGAGNHSQPYDSASAHTKAVNNIFKMNKDIGQHILKNPGIAQAIVQKAELKQSDVSSTPNRSWSSAAKDVPLTDRP